MGEAKNRGPLISAGTLLGVGMGGFVDGIVFHQLLQVHNMLSGKYPPITLVNSEINMFWDGLFHTFCWIMAALGLALLWRAGQRSDVPWSTRTFVGSLLLGAGSFNLVEGILDHHLLKIHNVIQRLGPSAWDYGFLAVGGVAMILVGGSVIRSGQNDNTTRGRAPIAG
jgi:uncharacterized membrane protein